MGGNGQILTRLYTWKKQIYIETISSKSGAEFISIGDGSIFGKLTSVTEYVRPPNTPSPSDLTETAQLGTGRCNSAPSTQTIYLPRTVCTRHRLL